MRTDSPSFLALALTSLVVTALSGGAAGQGGVADYPALTDNVRDFTNFNIETVRGLAPAPDGTLFALNTHASQVVHESDGDPEPERIIQTLAFPVSLALWGNDHLLVVGGATHALALHDLVSGDVLDVLQLPSEPADMVVDQQTDRAFIACQGANVVVMVDLNSFSIASQFAIPAERPRMLYLDTGTSTGPEDNVVYVAPFLSGNNSIPALPTTEDERTRVVDLSLIPGIVGLPDEDLFRIDPNVPNGVTVAARHAGTLMMGHGRHPDGQYWMLNVESLNKDPDLDTEPELRGVFARNRLTITTLVAGSAVTNHTFVDLDDAARNPANPQYSPASSVAFPFALEFAPGPSGLAFVASPLNDRVVILNAVGDQVGMLQLAPGSIPFDLAISQGSAPNLYVYCWGRNEVQVYSLTQPGVSTTKSLGLDPTPEHVRRGREIWYDGERSSNARTSCNTCHPGGKSDLLGWSISDDPNDPKDMMVTQSLSSIQDTFPYHWRGERRLIDFNDAFVGLLGGAAPLTTGNVSEFEDFEAFVFSLQASANPRQALSRQVDDAQTPEPFVDTRPTSATFGEAAIGSATQGLVEFQTLPTFLGRTCAQCHMLPTGTLGDFIDEVPVVLAPTAKFLEVAHLRELRHRDQPAVSEAGIVAARSGFGLTHAGIFTGIFDFVNDPPVFGLGFNQAANISAFVQQFDQGIAPAAHAAWMVDAAHPDSQAQVRDILVAQARTDPGWIDCVAFGTVTIPANGQVVWSRWLFDPEATGLGQGDWFFPSSPGLPPRNLTQLFSQADGGLASLVFLGVPPGNGRRFALDPDSDGLIDPQEPLWSCSPWDPDSDDDGFPDGYEVDNNSLPYVQGNIPADSTPPGLAPGTTIELDFVSASLAKVTFQTDEDTFAVLQATPPGGGWIGDIDPDYSIRKTMVLQGLTASTPALAGTGVQVTNSFAPELILFDRSFNSNFLFLSAFDSKQMIIPGNAADRNAPMFIADLSGTGVASDAGLDITGSVTARHRFNSPGPMEPQVVVDRWVLMQVVQDVAGSGEWTQVDGVTVLGGAEFVETFSIQPPPGNGGPARTFIGLPGPFLLVGPTSTSGVAPFKISVQLPSSDTPVRLNVLGILDPHPSGQPFTFLDGSLGHYPTAGTAIEKRSMGF